MLNKAFKQIFQNYDRLKPKIIVEFFGLNRKL